MTTDRQPIIVPLPHDGRASVNAVLLRGAPLTLVDTGLHTAASLAALRRGLAEHHLTVADLECIVITHAHLDHFGAGALLARESGARVVADAGGMETMAQFAHAWPSQQQYRLDLLRLSGAPQTLLDHAAAWGEHYHTLGDPLIAGVGLSEGDSIVLGDATWRVIDVPGHAASSIALFDEQTGALISGDVLLGNGASNVTLHRIGAGGLPAGWQRDIADSLRRLAAVQPRVAYPGHGPVIPEATEVIASRLQRIDDRLDQLRAWLSEPLTAQAIAMRLYEPAVAMTWVGLSAALGYVDALECMGLAASTVRDGVRFYQRPA